MTGVPVDSMSATLLRRYALTGDEDAIFTAFGGSHDRVAEVSESDPRYPDRLAEHIEVLFAYFGLTGNFSVIDAAIELLRRYKYSLPAPPLAVPERSWRIRHEPPSPGIFSRSLSDETWTVDHPNGQRSRIFPKNWDGWLRGGEWPTGWTVERPDGTRFVIDETRFGDDWMLDRVWL